MSKPTDTRALLHMLEQFAEAAESGRNAINKVAHEIEASNVAGLGEPLADAAVHAGMSPGNSAGYGEEYHALLSQVRDSLKAASAAADDAVSKLEGAAHIARVLPHRCPHRTSESGEAVLRLTR